MSCGAAVQAHSGWAYALDVTVLSAGFNYPPSGSTGSGIYRGRQGVLNATFNWRTESTLLVHTVPKRAFWEESQVKFYKIFYEIFDLKH